MGDMGNMGDGSMVLWWIGGFAILIVLVWLLSKGRGGK